MKLAKHLSTSQHEVRVISCRHIDRPRSLQIEIDGAWIHHTSWIDVNWLPKLLAKQRRASDAAINNEGHYRTQANHQSRDHTNVLRRASELYSHLLNWPDKQAGWIPFVCFRALSLFRTWRPDLILATSPPFSAIVAARIIGLLSGTRWVAEFRDRWSDDPYYPPPHWRQNLNRRLERVMLRSASALVTVSPPWANNYHRLYGKPTVVVYNGFDKILPRDPRFRVNTRILQIVYTGEIYPGRRDPEPLFQAIADIPCSKLRLDFYGPSGHHIQQAAQKWQATSKVHVHPEVTHAHALEIQRHADILLLLQWNNQRELGNVPGKLFEYLAALRPILLLGPANGSPAEILRQHDAGVCVNDPRQIRRQIMVWLEMKDRGFEIPDKPQHQISKFRREAQSQKLATFLQNIVRSRKA